MAQAAVLTGNNAYSEYVFRQLDHWWRENPFQRGINWTSALEVAFRALSWIWIFHLVGAQMSEEFRRRFLAELYRHGLHLEYNLSIYFSPNTHLLGEAVALHALGRLFPNLPRAKRWRSLGREIVCEHMQTCVQNDGSYFEQSTYYHLYALDMFAFHAVLEEVPADYRESSSAWQSSSLPSSLKTVVFPSLATTMADVSSTPMALARALRAPLWRSHRCWVERLISTTTDKTSPKLRCGGLALNAALLRAPVR